MTAPRIPATDSIELAEVVRNVRRGWRAVVACTVAGLVLAAAVLAFAPRRYRGNTTLMVKAGSESGGSLLSRVAGGVGDMIGGATGLDFGKSVIETELQVLNSRVLAGSVVDSLRLQARAMSPRGIAPASLVQAYALPDSFAPRTFEFVRKAANVHPLATGGGVMHMGTYTVSSGDFTGELTQGFPGRIPLGSLTLATTELPERFKLKLYDREEAVTRFDKRLDASKAAGEVVSISYVADDRATAAAAPNTLVAFYLDRRKTTDRGTNAKRVEFLSEQLAKTGAELSGAERALRVQQESSGILDATIMGRVGLEQAAELRKQLIEVQVEEGAINQLLARSADGTLTGRTLAAYPAFLRGASLNSLIGQLSELESERLKLLERRTEEDPEVVALTQSIKAIEGQFVPMARAYSAALSKQRTDLASQVDSMRSAMMAIPAAAESGGRLQRDVIRLSQIYAAVQAQLVQARLAAIDEGGDVRPIDVAVPPRKAWFPKPVTTMGVGFGGGLMVGLIAALLMSFFGRWVRDPLEIERATGLPALRLATEAPLLMAAQPVSRTVLVVPVEDRARIASVSVAERLAHTANNRALNATVLDLSADAPRLGQPSTNGNGSSPTTGVSGLIDDLEQHHGLVVVALPGLASEATVAALRDNRPVLLVAPRDRVDRARLVGAVETLRRLRVPCAGIVVGEDDGLARVV